MTRRIMIRDKAMARLNSQCSPSKLRTNCSNLTPQQKDAILDMGFGGLFELRIKSLNQLITLEIVKAFDEEDCCMHVMVRTYQVTYHDLGKVFGLPLTGHQIN